MAVIFIRPTIGGKALKVIEMTMILNVGDANMTARAKVAGVPLLKNPRAIGDTQFEHTPSGVPATVPLRAFIYGLSPNFDDRMKPINVKTAAPKIRPNVMPFLFV